MRPWKKKQLTRGEEEEMIVKEKLKASLFIYKSRWLFRLSFFADMFHQVSRFSYVLFFEIGYDMIIYDHVSLMNPIVSLVPFKSTVGREQTSRFAPLPLPKVEITTGKLQLMGFCHECRKTFTAFRVLKPSIKNLPPKSRDSEKKMISGPALTS